MFCSNSKGALVQFRASIRDGRDILSIHINKGDSVDLGTVSAEFRQFIHSLTAYLGSFNLAQLSEAYSDSIF